MPFGATHAGSSLLTGGQQRVYYSLAGAYARMAISLWSSAQRYIMPFGAMHAGSSLLTDGQQRVERDDGANNRSRAKGHADKTTEKSEGPDDLKCCKDLSGNQEAYSGLESHHFSCSSTRSSIQVIWRPDPTKDFDTTKPDTNFVLTSGAIRGTLTQPRFSKKLIMSTHEQITNNPTSAVRNTGGRNGPQGLEEPMSDEVLREMCDKNYHQLLPLIAEKMQKEKEQKDKLNAVKARLIYFISS
ncbi:hypothetical protein Tco_1000972 [Tanacetum coccineum]